MRILDIKEGTSVDGVGLRTSIYFAGCEHHCEGCHNPQSWNMMKGKEMSEDEVMKVIRKNDFPVTFSGGDAFYQFAEATSLARRIRDNGYSLWVYTGFEYEYLLSHPLLCHLLYETDILVDGRFEIDKRDTSLKFRGSSNQRIIDVQKSLQRKEIILWES